MGMAFWKSLWSLVWFGGLALFAVLAVIITVQGARDLRTLLRGLGEEAATDRRSPISRDDEGEVR